jgi:hypothetical protein
VITTWSTSQNQVFQASELLLGPDFGAGSRMVVSALFVAGLLLVGVVEVLARRENATVPTFSQICGFIMRYHIGRLAIGRIAMLGIWWWLGWHFFAR